MLSPSKTNDSTTSLVVFNYATAGVSDNLSLAWRNFNFFDQEVKIKQAWKEGGRGGSEIGFGCSVYNCSFVLAYYIEMFPDVIKDKRCLEVGCGPGLTSIAAALSGIATSITATDGDDISVDLARENIASNCTSSGIASSITAKRLLWGNTGDLNAFQPRSVDVLLAADVVAVPYEKTYDDLLDTMEYLLSDDGVIYLCYQQRHFSEAKFFRRFCRRFHVTRDPPDSIHPDFQKSVVPIQLFIARRYSQGENILKTG